jgi:hypothetical protein
MLSTTEFDFYHPQARENDINKNILELAEQDVRFFQFFNKGTYKKPLNFPKTAQFFHGCVRIRPKT